MHARNTRTYGITCTALTERLTRTVETRNRRNREYQKHENLPTIINLAKIITVYKDALSGEYSLLRRLCVSVHGFVVIVQDSPFCLGRQLYTVPMGFRNSSPNICQEPTAGVVCQCELCAPPRHGCPPAVNTRIQVHINRYSYQTCLGNSQFILDLRNSISS